MNEPTQVTRRGRVPHYPYVEVPHRGDAMGLDEFLYDNNILVIEETANDATFKIDVMADSKGNLRSFAEALTVVATIARGAAEDASQRPHDDQVIVQTVLAACLEQLTFIGSSIRR